MVSCKFSWWESENSNVVNALLFKYPEVNATGPPYLRVKSSTGTTPRSIEVNNNKFVAGICKSIHKLPCGMYVCEICSSIPFPPSNAITNFCLCPHLQCANVPNIFEQQENNPFYGNNHSSIGPLATDKVKQNALIRQLDAVEAHFSLQQPCLNSINHRLTHLRLMLKLHTNSYFLWQEHILYNDCQAKCCLWWIIW